MKDPVEAQIDTLLLPFSDDIIKLANGLRHFIRNETHPATELVGDSTLSLNIGYGFTEKAWDCYCAIIVYSKHINISFPSGVRLNDPAGLLQGSGKRIRHIRISRLDDIRNRQVLNLLKQARELAFVASGAGSEKSTRLRTIVKPIAGIKKRPG